MILNDADLRRFQDSPKACWVQDIDRARVTWANDAAVRLLRAKNLEDLYARDVSARSSASYTRLHFFRKRIENGGEISTQWTTFTDDGPVTFVADVHGMRAHDGTLCILIEAREMTDFICAETLRMLAAARHSMAFFSMYSLEGTLIERNAAFVREFEENPTETGDHFLRLFADRDVGQSTRGMLIANGEVRLRCQVITAKGVRWHMLLGLIIQDPVDGKRVMHIETVDISEQVEVEVRARDSEKLLEQIADEFPHPVAYLTNDRIFRFVNRTYCNWLGQSRSAIIGKRVRDVAGADLETIWDSLGENVARGERVYYEREVEYGGLGKRWVRVDVVPHTSETGEVTGLFVFGYDVQALKMSEASRRTTERQLELITNSLPIAVGIYDKDVRVRFANRPLLDWFNTRQDGMVGRHASDFIGVAVFDELHPMIARARAGELVQHRRRANLHNESRWVDVTMVPFDDGESNRDGLLMLFADVTKRVQANDALYKARNALSSHLANTPLAVIQLDDRRRITQWTGRATELFGWIESEVFGLTLDELHLFEEDSRSRMDQELKWLDQGSAARFTVNCRNRRKDGVALHGEWFVSILRAEGDVAASYLLLVQDISARVSAEHHLHYVANHDVLTGLANRTQFQERLRAEIARARRMGHSLGVVLLDLDRFKVVNESLGHSVGDALLQQVALRFASAVTQADLIARTGGDEFMLLVSQEESRERVRDTANALRALLEEPFRLGDQEVFATVSIGVSYFPEDADSDAELIKNADWAMYRAKDAGRNAVQYFSRTLARDAPMRLSLESELHRAVELHQLELHYQPKQNLLTKRTTGAEALLRWRHPVRGLVPPDEFISLAEESGLINELGAWVSAEVCRQIAAWRAEFGVAPQIAMNLSAVQLKRSELASEILAELRRHQLPGSALMVEVTETAVVSDPLIATITLDTLREHGVRAAIDDFGKGFSSLTQLKRLPIDALKIDGSFVRGVVLDRDDGAIVQAIIGLARNLDMHVIAEGLETPEQLAFLVRHQCVEAQGYLIARPLPAGEFAAQFIATVH